MTGREAFEEDVRRQPTYPGTDKPRKTWDELDEIQQLSWNRSPTPREWDR